MRWNSLVQSFGRNVESRAPNILIGVSATDPSHQLPAELGGTDRYYNHEAASNFPAELLYSLQFRAYVQR